MASLNRLPGENSTRFRLIDTTEQIMLEDGYAAVTYRTVAARAGVSLGAVQHHFSTLDDLFLAVVRQYSRRNMETMLAGLRDNPDDVPRVLWECSGDEVSTALFFEIMALANHRKIIQAEIAEFAQEYRKVQLDALTRHWQDLDLPGQELTPASAAFLLTCLPRWMRLSDFFQLSEGAADVQRLVQDYLDRTGVSPSGEKRSLVGHAEPARAGRSPNRSGL